jgi:hypothetical protein
MRITFKSLEQFAQQRGYTVERRGRMIEWYHNNDHSIIGVVYSVSDAYSEIKQDWDRWIVRIHSHILNRRLASI